MSTTRRTISIWAASLVLPLAAMTSTPSPTNSEPVTTTTTATATVQGKADPDSAKTCAKCHKAYYDEWSGRAHAHAWTNKVYQEALKGRKRPRVCYRCHIPGPVLKKLGKKPKTRKKLRHEGVTCVSCHQHEGKIHGPFGSKLAAAAHPVVQDPTFTAKGVFGLCASCHSTTIGPVLQVAKDFDKAGMAAKGKSCIGCHMPAVERHIATNLLNGEPVGKKRKGRSHAILGPNDKEFCAKAFGLSVKKDGKNIDLLVENKAGHKVPGLNLRDFVFHLRQLDAAGKEIGKHRFVINFENLLNAAETRHFPHKGKAGAKKVEVRIEHHFDGKMVAEILKKSFDL